MTLNNQPRGPIGAEERRTYQQEGAVCLRNVLDPEWIDLLLPIARRVVVEKEDFGLLPTMPGRYLSRRIPEFRRFIFESPLAEAGARAIGAKRVRFFFDELFAKPPRSESKTIWHTDRMGWPVEGEMVPSLWLPLGAVTAENSLEFVVGSHRRHTPHWLFSPNARQMVRPPDRTPHPDDTALRVDPANEFKCYAMEPGDLLVVHPATLHYSSGNSDDDWRIAVSTRIFGDDVRWKPRPDCVNLAGVSFDEMLEGEAPAGRLFPLLWSQDGLRDGDGNFPTGFATTWSNTRRRDEVNEDRLFASLLERNRNDMTGDPE